MVKCPMCNCQTGKEKIEFEINGEPVEIIIKQKKKKSKRVLVETNK